MPQDIPQFLIAAPLSGSGKTTVSRVLMALLCEKGFKVQPYKCGPDYIDTKFHTAVCNRPSVNLDTFMASPEHVRQLYTSYAQGADTCIVEGMMGLFDGYERDRGSAAEIAALLKLPVILVIDARSAAYSVAATLYGFTHFRPDIQISGVIFNRVGSRRHFLSLKEACTEVKLPCFGYLPRWEALEQQSRYLGLDFSQTQEVMQFRALAKQMAPYINVSQLMQSVSRPLATASTDGRNHANENIHIAVARDEEAFSFIYTEHADILKRLGKVTFFAPEENLPLPAGTDLLYLPGGYPEKHAERLAAATNTLKSIRQYIEKGGRALAECGGMIYLSQGIHQDTPSPFVPLAGVLPFSISNKKEHRKLCLGYRQFSYGGQQLHGHEFHYTIFSPDEQASSFPASVAQVYNARKQPVQTPVFRYKNLLASYTHLYWGETDLLSLFARQE